MPDYLGPMRSGLNMALAYTLPLLAWLLAQSLLLSAGQAGPEYSLQLLFNTLLLLQAGAVTLCLPWLLRYPSRLGQACAVTVLLWVPLPLYALTWLAGAAPASSLVLALLCLFGLALLLYCWYFFCLALSRPGQLRTLLLLGTQVVALAAYWNYRADWQRLLGL